MSKYNYEVTLHYLCGSKRSWKVVGYQPDTYDLEKMTKLYLQVEGKDKEHNIYTSATLEIDTKDVETVVIHKKGKRTVVAARLHRKKTPDTQVLISI